MPIAPLAAQDESKAPPVQQQYKPQHFTYQEVMIPMRDGVRLQTVIMTPKQRSRAAADPADDELPTACRRMATSFNESGRADDLIADGYIFVFQNIRGRFKSEGTFVMQRPPRDKSDPKAIDEGTDAYDTIDWLIKNVPNNNGRVGIWGISYPGWLVTQALLDPHPALKAASEQASPADMFISDDFHHNGAFRLSYGFEYSALMESRRRRTPISSSTSTTPTRGISKLGALSNVNARYFHGKLPTWNDFVEHPNHDFWKQHAVTEYLKHTTVPNLNVAGWYDQEDFVGPTRIYATLEQTDSDHLNYFVAGPWNHGGWMGESGRKLGDIDWGSDISRYYRAHIFAPWFAHWLHDKPLNQPEAITFETGSDQWKSYDKWPPTQGVTERKLYLHAEWQAVVRCARRSRTRSTPTSPIRRTRCLTVIVRSRRPIPNPTWTTWLVEDQRFVEHRPDVLTWQTDPLTEDVTVTGDIVADLFAATTGSDSDWVVKLIDVYPEDYQKITEDDAEKNAGPVLNGYELMIADDILRGRYRNSFETPEPITPNKVTEYKIDLHPNDHVFLKGHRIMVQVQSTWFPLYDRNPQKFVPNIYKATDADYMKATQKIYRSKDAASSIVLPVVEK